MSQKLFEDEIESQPQVSYMPLFAVAICLGLSLLCSLLWVFSLLWPQSLRFFQS